MKKLKKKRVVKTIKGTPQKRRTGDEPEEGSQQRYRLWVERQDPADEHLPQVFEDRMEEERMPGRKPEGEQREATFVHLA